MHIFIFRYDDHSCTEEARLGMLSVLWISFVPFVMQLSAKNHLLHGNKARFLATSYADCFVIGVFWNDTNQEISRLEWADAQKN